MKKFAAFVLASAMLLSLCACTGKSRNDLVYSSSTATDITRQEIQQMASEANSGSGSAESGDSTNN